MLLGLTRDSRLKGWWLMDSPSGILSICALYLVVVLKLGPDWMRDRKPLNIKFLVRGFNLLQVISNSYFVIYGAYLAYGRVGFRLICEPSHMRTDQESLRLLSLYYFYFLIRLSDFVDTLFFVLAKKQGHVSFLHVYHHLCVVLNGWIGLRSGWINGVLFGIFMNASIHIIMYSYFMLATFPKMRPYLWWKKYLTSAQIIQFLVFCYFATVVVKNKHDCGYPQAMIYSGIANVILLLLLFSKFYLDTYIRNKRSIRPTVDKHVD
ncbi:elongation of very long chain fatty acids protein 4-like [Galendromus occidentalis]|uniref:Elongation of very long chain fatty acids protein n=1 Tax=Galendromus occidentalis TaxID=34638 RepID=A0AAJ6QMK8_9ACAR|nr:elongation of very long chain fatty acids protein 4-like [Galendromus occidentalis]